jgi:hypothetical protein
MFQRLRRHSTMGIVALSCLAIGGGASAIANAGAASPSSHSAAAHAYRAGLGRRLLARAVHGDLVVATRTGFVTVTYDRGIVQSVSGNQLVLNDGTKKATYKTVTLTIPATAHVRDNGAKATLGEVKSGQRAIVIQAPHRTWVIAHNVR